VSLRVSVSGGRISVIVVTKNGSGGRISVIVVMKNGSGGRISKSGGSMSVTVSVSVVMKSGRAR
jgi:hypothetical protein